MTTRKGVGRNFSFFLSGMSAHAGHLCSCDVRLHTLQSQDYGGVWALRWIPSHTDRRIGEISQIHSSQLALYTTAYFLPQVLWSQIKARCWRKTSSGLTRGERWDNVMHLRITTVHGLPPSSPDTGRIPPESLRRQHDHGEWRGQTVWADKCKGGGGARPMGRRGCH